MILSETEKRFLKNKSYLTWHSFLSHHKEFGRFPYLESLKNKLQGLPAVCFDQAEELDLRTLRQQVIILARSDQWEQLRSRGIMPHFCLVMEGASSDFIAGMDANVSVILTNLTPWVSSNQAYSVVVDSLSFKGFEAVSSLQGRDRIASLSLKEIARVMGLDVMNTRNPPVIPIDANSPVSVPSVPSMESNVDRAEIEAILKEISSGLDILANLIEQSADYLYWVERTNFKAERLEHFGRFVDDIRGFMISWRSSLRPFIAHILSQEDENLTRLIRDLDHVSHPRSKVINGCLAITEWLEGHFHWLSFIGRDLERLGGWP